jgi:hypothetical protein
VGAALLGFGFLVLAPHVQHGSFYSDDWANAAAYHFEGWWRTGVYEWRHTVPGRPLLAFLHPVPYVLLGLNPGHHLAGAVVLAALTSLSFFAFLRVLGIEFPHAFAMATLALVFPWAGAARLWPTGAFNNLAVMAYFLGSIAALRGLSLWDNRRRSAVALHVVASLLYLASVLTYEVAASAIVLSGLLYRTHVSWRALRARWLTDAALVLVPLMISVRLTSRVRHVGSLNDRVEDIPHFVGQGLSLFALIFVPRDLSRSWASSWDPTSAAAGKLALLGAVAAVIAAAAVRSRRREQHELRRWLYRFGGGAFAVIAAYFMFLGSGLLPLFWPGIDDRINTFAAFGFVVAAYSVLALAALLIGGDRRPAVAAVVLAAGTVLVGFGFTQRVRDDVNSYDAAAAGQRYLLEKLRVALPRPPPGTTIFTFGYPAQSARGVPIFETSWELRGAVNLQWSDRSLRAAPIYREGVSCDRNGINAPALGGKPAVAYGRAVFIDVPTARSRNIESRGDCLVAREVFRPGPYLRSDRR